MVSEEEVTEYFKRHCPGYRIIFWNPGGGVPAELHPGRSSIDLDPAFFHNLNRKEMELLLNHEIAHEKAFTMALPEGKEHEYSAHEHPIFSLINIRLNNESGIRTEDYKSFDRKITDYRAGKITNTQRAEGGLAYKKQRRGSGWWGESPRHSEASRKR